jgi:hypothetical protein
MTSSAPAAAEHIVRRARLRACAVVLLSTSAWAERAAASEVTPHEPLEQLGAPAPLRGIAALSVGRGLRFNNPFRLATPLGSTPESVSVSATYLDLTVAALWVQALGFQHGVGLSGVVALNGIGQFGLTPSYLLQGGVAPALELRGRLGVPIVVAPDTTVGLEAAFGSLFAVAFGLGVTAELVGNLFFGAATEERSVTTIPMLSLQVGLFFDHEFAP